MSGYIKRSGGMIQDFGGIKMRVGYHVTTPKKLSRYEETGCILEPVRFWSNVDSAKRWGRRAGRGIVLKIEVQRAWPLPDHKPRGAAWWTDESVRTWQEVSDD